MCHCCAPVPTPHKDAPPSEELYAPIEWRAAAEYEDILYERGEAIARITINRPEVRNALNAEVLTEIGEVLGDAESDHAVQGIIFTGAGEKAFIAGADISGLVNYTAVDGLTAAMQKLYDRIENFPRPTLAAINGYALGGGCELAMACDLRIASTTAQIGLPETALGVLPGAGGTQRLTRLVGRGRAVDMILSGRFVPAEEALQMGLVTRVTEPGELLNTARDTLLGITARGPLAIRLAKLVIRHGADADQATGQIIERLAQSLLYQSEDKAEGAGAFLEKRAPRFTGQ